MAGCVAGYPSKSLTIGTWLPAVFHLSVATRQTVTPTAPPVCRTLPIAMEGDSPDRTFPPENTTRAMRSEIITLRLR